MQTQNLNLTYQRQAGRSCLSEGLVDLLQATRIHNLPLGVNRTTGMCTSRPGFESEPDVAYSISERTILTVQTAQLFPLGYPQDFSLLLVVSPTKGKPLHGNRYKLLAAVSAARISFPGIVLHRSKRLGQ